MNLIPSIVVTLGLIVTLNGNPGYQRDLVSALDLLLINPQADISATEALYLYPLERNRTAPERLFLASYIVTRQALQPALDFEDRVQSLKIQPPPGQPLTIASQRFNAVLDLLLERKLDPESAALLLLRMQPINTTLGP